MKIDIENLSAVKKKLSISVPEEEVTEEFERVYKKVSKQAQVPGFRPGKVPREILEKKYGSAIEAEVFEDLVRRTVVAAMEEHKLSPVAVPKISTPKREKGSGFSYVADVEVKPSLTPKDYKGVAVKKTEPKVTDEQIQEVFKRLQDSQAVLKTREGAKKPVKGDFVSLILQEIEENGTPKKGPEPREQVFEFGTDSLHAEIETAVKKLGIDESAPAIVENKGEKIHLQVTLKAIKEKVLPSLDDAFAKSVGPFENLKALREQVEKDLKEEAIEKAKGEAAQKILETLLKKNPIELPETLVHDELHGMIHGIWAQFERAGIQDVPEDYSEKKLHEKLLPDAQRRIHEQLLLEAIAEKENLTVPDSELNERFQEMAKQSKTPWNELRAYYEKTNRLETLRFQMLAQKTLDFLLAEANIK